MHYITSEYDVDRVRLAYTCIVDQQTDQELEQRLADYKQGLITARSQGLRRISILDFSVSNQYSARQRRIQSDWNRECDELLRALEIELIFVTPSALMRGVITAVFWVAPPPFEYSVWGDLAAALDHAFELCERSGARIDHNARKECRERFFSVSEPQAEEARRVGR